MAKKKGLDMELLLGDGISPDSITLEKPKNSKKSAYPPEMLAAPYYKGHDYAFITNWKEWDAAIQGCLEECARPKGVVGFDIETDGRDPFLDSIHGFSLSWGKGVARYVFWNLVELDKERVARDLNKLKLVTQGGKFDYHFLAEHLPGLKPYPYADTMMLLHLLDPDAPKGLKLNAWVYLNYHMMTLAECLGVDENALKKGKVAPDFNKVPKERLLHYGCHDADITRQLYYVLDEKIVGFEGPAQVDNYLQVPVLMELERTGLLVNKEYLTAITPVFERCIARMEKQIYDIVGHPFDIFSPQQVGNVLFNEMGLLPLKFTKTGKASVTAEDLERLAEGSDNEVLNWIVEAKHHAHSLSAYVRGLLNGVCEKTGALHAEYGQCTAPTFRLNCSKGAVGGGGLNVQQIPKEPEILRVELADEEVENLKAKGVDVGHWTVKDGKGKLLEGHIPDNPGLYDVVYKARKAFVARPGKYFVSADYQAIEFRLIVNFCGEEETGRAIREGLDSHKKVASLMYRKPMDEISKEERNATKTLSYGLAYGMSPWSLKLRLNISEELAQDLYNRYFQAMPRMKEYFNAIKKWARKKGYVSTYWGRRRFIKDYEKDRNKGDRSAVNTVIQGSAADAMRIALVKSHMKVREYYGHKVQLVATLHDQIIFEVDNSIKLEEFIPVLRAGMEMDREDWLCGLPVDISYGQNWGDLEDWEDKSDDPEKEKRVTIHILKPDPIINEEIKFLLEELQDGEARLYIGNGEKTQEIKQITYDRDRFEQFQESLGPFIDHVRVIVEDVTPEGESGTVEAGN